MTQAYLIIYPPSFVPGRDVPCVKNPKLFAGRPPNSHRHKPTASEAKAILICYTCPVLEKCRDWALQHAAEEDIVMGGMTGWQRREYLGRHGQVKRPPSTRGRRRVASE